MDKRLDDLEMLDELEDVEENDSALNDQYATMETPQPKTESGGLLSRIKSLYGNLSRQDIQFPLALIDRNLNILEQNEQMKKITRRELNGKPLPLHYIFEESQKDNPKGSLLEDKEKSLEDHNWKGLVTVHNVLPENFIANLMVFPSGEFDDKGAPKYIGIVDNITDEYKKILRGTFLSLLEASKLKDNDTGLHIQRVNRYSYLLAKKLMEMPEYREVDSHYVENIGFLAAMHDVGKIGTPDDILNKEGPLEDWEREVMKEHPKNGAFLLGTYPNPMARQIALSHHEKYDGTGYPYGLFEDMIPLCARIVALADVYDALRSKRSYKNPMTHEVALEYLRSQRGKHFDPVLTDLFLDDHQIFNDAFSELSDEKNQVQEKGILKKTIDLRNGNSA